MTISARRWRIPGAVVLTVAAFLGGCETASDEPDGFDEAAVDETQQAVVTADGCNLGDERLPEYARSCANAMGGIEVPGFDCDEGVEVPDTQPNGTKCDRPNVLNSQCDPGSRFQVLVDQNNANNQRVVMVAHCRKKGAGAGKYKDVAIIAYNYATGDTCFFQDKSPGGENSAIAPAPKDDGANDFWSTPAGTAGMNCVGCHDNGPFVRSPYLTQLKGTPGTESPDGDLPAIEAAQAAADAMVPKAILPGSREAGWNFTQPYRFVGKNFQGWKAYAVSVQDNQCTTCHRMGISSHETPAFSWVSGSGSAQRFGLLATGDEGNLQLNKNPHTGTMNAAVTSPIWMLPTQKSYSDAVFQEAKAIQTCAQSIVKGGALPDGCGYAQFAQGNTCHGSGVGTTVNGETVTPPTSEPHVDEVDIPAGPNAAFGGWTSLHGPFVEKSTNIPFGSAGFDGTIAALRVVGNPSHFKILAGWDGPPANPPRPGAGGQVEFTFYSEIAGVPANPSCTYGGAIPLTDLTGANLVMKTPMDNGLKKVDIPTTFIGNLSFAFEKDFYGVREAGPVSNLQRTISKVGAFEGEAFAYGCNGWTPTYSVLHKGTTSDVELIAAPNAKKHRCILTGISGNWSATANQGKIQPYAEIYFSGQSTRLRVSQNSSTDRIYAEASCIQIQP